MKEKLIELLHRGARCPGTVTDCMDCPHHSADNPCDEFAATARMLIDNGVTVQEWIPVTERLPEPETEVLVLAERKYYSFKTKSPTIHHIVLTGMYEDGSKNTEDSEWWWYDHDFKYDEELDVYIIPEGWWEYKHYNGDDEHNHPIDDCVTHWMPLPEPPNEGE